MVKTRSSKWNSVLYFLIASMMSVFIMSNSNAIDNNDVPSISPIKVGEYEEISSVFGMRTHPVHKVEKFHSGIDFRAKSGTKIMATADGVVTKVTFQKEGYGKMIMIDHGNGIETMYSHMQDFAVKMDDRVEKGDLIGFVGSTGLSEKPHLHYEVHKEGKPVNPEDYIQE